jgi:hypothetical protein
VGDFVGFLSLLPSEVSLVISLYIINLVVFGSSQELGTGEMGSYCLRCIGLQLENTNLEDERW